jgi:hypothetical protein
VSRTKEIQLLSKGTKALKALFIPKRVASKIYGTNTLMFLEACIQILNLLELFVIFSHLYETTKIIFHSEEIKSEIFLSTVS